MGENNPIEYPEVEGQFVTDYDGLLKILFDEPVVNFSNQDGIVTDEEGKKWTLNTFLKKYPNGYFHVTPVGSDIHEYRIKPTTEPSPLDSMREVYSGEVIKMTPVHPFGTDSLRILLKLGSGG